MDENNRTQTAATSQQYICYSQSQENALSIMHGTLVFVLQYYELLVCMHTLVRVVLELRESIKLLVISMLALTKVVHTRVLLTSMHTWRRTDCQRFSLPSSFSLLSLLPRSLMDGTSCGRLIIIRYFIWCGAFILNMVTQCHYRNQSGEVGHFSLRAGVVAAHRQSRILWIL